MRLAERPTIVDLLVAHRAWSTGRGAARRTVAEGGAYVNNAKVADDGWVPAEQDLLPGRWLVVRAGKRNLAGVRVERLADAAEMLRERHPGSTAPGPRRCVTSPSVAERRAARSLGTGCTGP